ncbi:DnaJ domain-containing protein [Myxococcota bacterium]|nr:DnaJ domain-containing protein [Myxococcota bacterium]
MATESPENLYAVLGVGKTATKEEIQSAFKKRARELHPDVNKAPDAEERFKQLVGAYEILRDEEKRKRYDLFGGLNGNAQRPRPKYDTYQPPGGPGPRPSSTAGAPGAGGPGGAKTKDDFDDLFGFGFGEDGSTSNPFDYFLRKSQKKKPKKPEREVKLTIPLEQAFNGTTLSITLEEPGTKETQRFKIKIPQGAKEGDRLKLKDPPIIVVLHIEPHPRFELDGRDITTTLELSPWEAVLGADVDAETPGGSVKLKVPPGTSTGAKLRLRGQGLPVKPGKEGEPGDLYVKVKVVVPRELSDKERDLWRQLSELSQFNPRIV